MHWVAWQRSFWICSEVKAFGGRGGFCLSGNKRYLFCDWWGIFPFWSSAGVQLKVKIVMIFTAYIYIAHKHWSDCEVWWTKTWKKGHICSMYHLYLIETKPLTVFSAFICTAVNLFLHQHFFFFMMTSMISSGNNGDLTASIVLYLTFFFSFLSASFLFAWLTLTDAYAPRQTIVTDLWYPTAFSCAADALQSLPVSLPEKK